MTFKEHAPELARLKEQFQKTMSESELKKLDPFWQSSFILGTWYQLINFYACMDGVDYLKIIAEVTRRSEKELGLPQQELFVLARDIVDEANNGYVSPRKLQTLKTMAPRDLAHMLSLINSSKGHSYTSNKEAESLKDKHGEILLAWMYTISVTGAVEEMINEKGINILSSTQRQIIKAALADEVSVFAWSKDKPAP